MSNKYTTIEALLVGAIMCILAILLLTGCSDGDDSSDIDELQRQQQAPSVPNNVACAHDGDIWICDEQNSCVKDESQNIEAESEEVDDMARVNYFAREKATGNITVISECGSNVYFNIVEGDDINAE